MSRVALIIALSFFFTLYGTAQTSKIAKEPTPSWVTSTVIDYHLSSMDNDAEDGFVDLDYEKQVSLASETKYYKKAIKILSESGVENSSGISIDFDPTYQKLVFHSLKIVRGKQSIDKLASTKFKVVQQEKDLDKHLYDGSLTAISFLEDVRKGDVLEYSYSLKGFNPIFNGKFAGFFDVQFSVPIYNLTYKLVVPTGRNVIIKNRGTEVRPFFQQLQSESVYEWKLSNIEPLHAPDHTPGWFDPYPMVMTSEYKSWKEINDWAKALYRFDIGLSAALDEKIRDIEQSSPNAENKILAALRFVQDDIRYTGIEAGENSHRPHHPDRIFNQRFGDCKDKSYLLCVMLRKMGIEANPVLINTDAGKAITSWLPSPNIFDHVTVQVKFDKDIYWFDPTISYQRGSIKNISYPDYQYGLVISESTNSLTNIPLNEKGRISSKEAFNVPDMSGLAYLTVTTEYFGKNADKARDDFKNNSRYEMLKKYREYYSSYFENIKGDSILFLDDEITGIVTTKEYYTIHDFWKLKDGINKASLQPFLIDEVLKKPEEGQRTAPYLLNFPLDYQEEIEISLPEEWEVDESSDDIKNESTEFKYDYSCSGNRVLLKYEYKTLKDFIASNEFDNYLADYKKINSNAGFSLTYGEKNISHVKGISTPGRSKDIFPALYTLLVIAILITVAMRKNKSRNSF